MADGFEVPSVIDEFQYAIWYMQHGTMKVEVFDDEQEAADFAYSTEEYGYGSVDGVQRSDGRTETYYSWPAIQEKLRRDLDHSARLSIPHEPKVMVYVTSPFDGERARVEEGSLPEWVGKHE